MQFGPASQTIRWGPSSGAFAGSDVGGNKAACGFVLLGVVEAKHGVQPVKQATQFDDVFGLGALVGQAGEQLPEQADLVFDLGVGAAESGGGVRAAQHPRNEGHQLCLVGSLVREQLGLKLVEQLLERG